MNQQTAQISAMSPQEAMEMENEYGAHNYKPLPVVLSRGEGVHVWDVNGKQYYDFLSAYSALNQGHCHPRLVKTVREQAGKLTLTSRAFYNDKLGPAEKFLSETFGYDKTLMMNSGAEAVESALKLARRWGYDKKGIPENHAVIVAAVNNFHGRTIGVISLSTDKSSRGGFGPFMPGVYMVPFDDAPSLEKALQNPNVCGFIVEPIQGEAGVIVPADDYLNQVRELCTRHNVLMIADEVQTGIGRTGRMICCDYNNVKPDILILGKALSGGMLPVSCVLCNDDIMLNIRPGEHGSTFGGNALAGAVAIEAVKIIQDEGMIQNAYELGMYFRERMVNIKSNLIRLVRGKGLLNAIKINEAVNSPTAYELCMELMENGLLAKQTHGNVIRFAPPLLITKEQITECCDIIEHTIVNHGKFV